MAKNIVTARLNQKKIAKAVKLAKRYLGVSENWKNQWEDLDETLSCLTPAELMTVESHPKTPADILPYMWTYLVDRAFESVWAAIVLDPEIAKENREIEPPEGFDPYEFRGVPCN